MTFLYFAYGSNMLSARLKARCPSARVIGKARAGSHVLEFTKPSADSSGKATLVKTGDHELHSPGVLFEIAKADLSKLDRAEGAGYGYDRHDEFQIQLAGEEERVVATTYIASKTQARLKPYDWYLALVIAGADQHQLGATHTQNLREIDYVIDTDLARKGRIDALAALSAHGIDDHHILLKGM